MESSNSLSEQEQTAIFAYKIYEDEGRQDGKADEHWARAERLVREQRMAVPESDREGVSAEALEPPAHMVP